MFYASSGSRARPKNSRRHRQLTRGRSSGRSGVARAWSGGHCRVCGPPVPPALARCPGRDRRWAAPDPGRSALPAPGRGRLASAATSMTRICGPCGKVKTSPTRTTWCDLRPLAGQPQATPSKSLSPSPGFEKTRAPQPLVQALAGAGGGRVGHFFSFGWPRPRKENGVDLGFGARSRGDRFCPLGGGLPLRFFCEVFGHRRAVSPIRPRPWPPPGARLGPHLAARRRCRWRSPRHRPAAPRHWFGPCPRPNPPSARLAAGAEFAALLNTGVPSSSALFLR